MKNEIVKQPLSNVIELRFNHLMEGYAQGLLSIIRDTYNQGHTEGEAYAYQNMLAMLDKHANKDGVKI